MNPLEFICFIIGFSIFGLFICTLVFAIYFNIKTKGKDISKNAKNSINP